MNRSKPWKAAGWPTLQSDWVGRYAVTNREMKNSLAVIPSGTKVRVASVTHGRAINIETKRCPECGVRVVMSRVAWSDLDLLSEK